MISLWMHHIVRGNVCSPTCMCVLEHIYILSICIWRTLAQIFGLSSPNMITLSINDHIISSYSNLNSIIFHLSIINNLKTLKVLCIAIKQSFGTFLFPSKDAWSYREDSSKEWSIWWAPCNKRYRNPPSGIIIRN